MISTNYTNICTPAQMALQIRQTKLEEAEYLSHTTPHSPLVGSPTTILRAELIAIREVTSLVSKLTPSADHIVILTDSRSCLEGLTSPRDHLEGESWTD